MIFPALRILRLTQVGVAVRTMILDNAVRNFLDKNPDAVVINLGAGLDTRYARLKPEKAKWYDLDIPESIALRRRFFEETEQHKLLYPSSMFDLFLDRTKLKPEAKQILFIAEGLLMYFPEDKLKTFFLVALTDRFPGSLKCSLKCSTHCWLGQSKRHETVRKIDSKAEFMWGLKKSDSITSWHPGIEIIEEWNYLEYEKKRWGIFGVIARLPLIRISNRIVRLCFTEGNKSGAGSKNKASIGRLLEIAGERKGFLIVSGVLSVISALFMLVPYLSIYFIMAELLKNASDISNANGTLMIRWGIIALLGVIAGMIFLYLGSMASHIAAFRILYGLRVKLSEHLGDLYLGYLSRTSTGAVKKTLEQNVEKIEQFIAHQIPDLFNVLATIVVMFLAMFFLNPWMALACALSITLGFSIQFSMMYGERAEGLMRTYHDSLERINASAIQYVRGMPAVKLFGQTVRSFRKFHDDMISYRDMATKWTDEFQNGYILFKTILATFLCFILPVGVLLLSVRPESMALALSLLFFIIMAPGTAAPIYKLMSLSSTLRNISEGVRRIDLIFSEPPAPESSEPGQPGRFDLEFDNVSFSYGLAGESSRAEALSEVSFRAPEGSITALVGPSGSGKSTAANLIPVSGMWEKEPSASAGSMSGTSARKT